MKKIVSIVGIILCIVIIGIVIKIYVIDKQKNNTKTDTNANESVIQNQDSQAENQMLDENTIKLSFQGNEIIVKMEESITATGFLNSLPKTMVFEDYQNAEKITNLDEPLPTNRMISQITPVTGDVCYYASSNNISMFYKDGAEQTGLYKIGTVIQGMEHVSKIQNGTEITIEK